METEHDSLLDCKACPAGKAFVNTITECEICGAGMYQDSNNKTNPSCTSCTGTYITDAGQNATEHDERSDCKICTAGKAFVDTITECGVCGAGQYQGSNDKLSPSCTSCIGTYITDDGQTVADHDELSDCKTCPIGYEITGTDLTQCHVCGYSKYQDQTGVTGVECRPCLKDTYITDDNGEGVAHDNVKDCVACATGKFANAGERACDSCTAGKEASTSTKASGSSCDACAAGQYSAVETNSVCAKCPHGFYQSTQGAPYCLPCLRKYII